MSFSTIARRLLCIAVGCVAATLGIVGIWVPGLPTTVFILIALWAFSRSSPRLHRWLTRLLLLKQTIAEIDRYGREKTVTRGTKLISQISAWGSFILLTILLQNWVVSLIVGILAATCSIFMFMTPTRVYRHKNSAENPVDS